MPGQTGNATRPGDHRNSAATAALEGLATLVGVPPPAFVSSELVMTALPGVSIVVDGTTSPVALTVQVEVKFGSDSAGVWYPLPSFVVGIGAVAFQSYDHLGARLARVRFTAAGPGPAGGVPFALSACA